MLLCSSNTHRVALKTSHARCVGLGYHHDAARDGRHFLNLLTENISGQQVEDGVTVQRAYNGTAEASI